MSNIDDAKEVLQKEDEYKVFLSKPKSEADKEVLGLDPETNEKVAITEDMMADGLPTPCGWRILVSMPEAERTYAGGIIKADATIRNEEVSSVVARVWDMGPDAYSDKERYPNGPWCKVGDYVIIRAYSGTRFKVYGKEFRLINEDTVEGVVADPRGYTRI